MDFSTPEVSYVHPTTGVRVPMSQMIIRDRGTGRTLAPAAASNPRVGNSGSMSGLWRRFRLGSESTGPLSLSSVVMPVIDVDRMAQQVENSGTVNISAADVTVYTCPRGMRAALIWFDKGGSTGNTAMSATVNGRQHYLCPPGSSEVITFVPNPIYLYPGDTLVMLSAPNGADTAIRYGYFVREEEYG